MVERNFEALLPLKGKINVLSVPEWFATEEKGSFLIKKYLDPNQIVTLHVSPQSTPSQITTF